jgi:spore cortex biosynthesis protein YabQ
VETSTSLVLEQFYAFLESLVLGIVLGACFDLYRALRLQGRKRVVTTASIITDCLFWIGAAAACIAVIIARRWGEMYFYNYLALAGGFSGYIYFFSRFLLPLWIRLFALIIYGIISLFRFLTKVGTAMAAPFCWFGRLAGSAAGRIRKLFSESYCRIPGCFRRRRH